MLIADAQVHIWGANTPQRPWPARHKAHRDAPISARELLHETDAAGVNRVVIVPPSWEGDRNDLAPAVHLPRGHYHVHGGDPVAHRAGQGMDHGSRRVRVARLEAVRGAA
jgi:hypothetical protein